MGLTFPVRCKSRDSIVLIRERQFQFHIARHKQRETPYYSSISGHWCLSLGICFCFLCDCSDSANESLFACQAEELIRF